MPKSTEENEQVKETVMGVIGDATGGKPNIQIRYYPLGPKGKPTIPIGKIPEPVYDENGKLLTEPSSGKIVDVKA